MQTADARVNDAHVPPVCNADFTCFDAQACNVSYKCLLTLPTMFIVVTFWYLTKTFSRKSD